MAAARPLLRPSVALSRTETFKHYRLLDYGPESLAAGDQQLLLSTSLHVPQTSLSRRKRGKVLERR